MLEKYLRKYRETFGEGFPMYQLGRGRTEEEVIAVIMGCLDAGKDAYELGLVTDNEDIEY